MSCIEWSLELRTVVYIWLVIDTNSKAVTKMFQQDPLVSGCALLFCFFIIKQWIDTRADIYHSKSKWIFNIIELC